MALTHHILGLAESLGLQHYLVITKFNIYLKNRQAFNESRLTVCVTGAGASDGEAVKTGKAYSVDKA